MLVKSSLNILNPRDSYGKSISYISQFEQEKLIQDLTREHACGLCGMITVDFPGSKGQIHYSNGKIDAFCCTLDMFSFYLQPDSPKNITAIFVNDMGKSDWERPSRHWIDAKKAYYVFGGNIMGPMGEALVPFSELKDDEGYVWG